MPVLAALFLASCDRSAIDPSQSLVGAKSLPSASELSRETIEINSGYGDISIAVLSYQLRPDNSLVVSLTERKYPEPDSMLGKEAFQLSPTVALDARRMLWRLRPQKLEGVEWETRPVGCKRRGPHDFGELAIVFINEGREAGVEDDRLGIFELPRPDSCATSKAVEARKLVQQILRTFPPSKIPAEFERREAEFFN